MTSKLKIQLQSDLTTALKQGEALKRSVLGMVITAVKNKELQKRGQLSKTNSDPATLTEQSQLTDEEIITVLAGEVKKRKEAIEQFTVGQRSDLVKKEMAELKILTKYLPAQLSEAEIFATVQAVITQTEGKDKQAIGKIIGLVMTKLKGQADGNKVRQLVQAALNQQ